MIISWLFYIFVVVAIAQVIYYMCFSVFAFTTERVKKAKQNIPVSVVICAKNEAQNLQTFLPTILHQNYKNFEIVLINDASIDKTLEVMEDFKKQYNNITIVNVKNNEAFWGNKKYALTLGIKATKNNYLLLTDADCKIASKNWISEITNQFSTQKSIILGYSKYKKENTLLNLFIRYETLLTAIQYFSYAKLGSPYMAVGRNLAYQKSEFYKVNGFINHMNIRSGDDDLFIQDAATAVNTTYCVSKESYTISKAPNSFKEWFKQKRRHISTAKYYKFIHQFLLGFFFLSKFIFIFFAILLLFLYDWKIIIPIIAVYYIIQWVIIGFSAKKLHETQLLFFLPFLEIGLVLFQFSIFIANTISKPVHWK